MVKAQEAFPTASAVLSDISALRYDYRYEYKKLSHHTPHELTHDFFVKFYISFDDWKDIPKDDFESILEWHSDQERKYLIGIIHFAKLMENNWWKENNVSFILTPDPIIESMDVRDLKKRSLELAGILTIKTQ